MLCRAWPRLLPAAGLLPNTSIHADCDAEIERLMRLMRCRFFERLQASWLSLSLFLSPCLHRSVRHSARPHLAIVTAAVAAGFRARHFAQAASTDSRPVLAPCLCVPRIGWTAPLRPDEWCVLLDDLLDDDGQGNGEKKVDAFVDAVTGITACLFNESLHNITIATVEWLNLRNEMAALEHRGMLSFFLSHSLCRKPVQRRLERTELYSSHPSCSSPCFASNSNSRSQLHIS